MYNFENLTLITGGDPALDIDLLDAFLLTSREYVSNLRTAHQSNDVAAWLREIHGMKGGAFNIGADALGQLCEKAEKHPQNIEARADILQKIEAEFATMEPFILKMIAERKTRL